MKEQIILLKKMLVMVKPLKFPLLCAIVFGVLGHLCAISIPVLSLWMLLEILAYREVFFPLLLILAVCRGVFAYLEQQRNHYIAFTILAHIRDRVFTALRRLCPAKLEGKNRGDLLSLITADIELLEVFYAHTLSPIAIALSISALVAVVMAQFHPVFALFSLLAQGTVGIFLPLWTARKNTQVYSQYRENSAQLGDFYLDSLRGVQELIAFDQAEPRLALLKQRSKSLEKDNKIISQHTGQVNALGEVLVLGFSGGMLLLSAYLATDFSAVLLPTVLMMSSFGPVLSLSKLSGGLSRTLAAAKRVHALLEEEPVVEEVIQGKTPPFTGVQVKNLHFSYDNSPLLQDVSLSLAPHSITSVLGKSGSGKSTLVKLMMGFWQSEGIFLGDTPLSQVQTSHLRQLQSYMTQESDLFRGSILDNIRIGKLDASLAQVEEAAKKASIHSWIKTLPQGYDTPVGELGSQLSGGEKQRIALARAFLHPSALLILDEPTSSLDALNEAMILQSIAQEKRCTILITHRPSSLAISHACFAMKEGRLTPY